MYINHKKQLKKDYTERMKTFNEKTKQKVAVEIIESNENTKQTIINTDKDILKKDNVKSNEKTKQKVAVEIIESNKNNQQTIINTDKDILKKEDILKKDYTEKMKTFNEKTKQKVAVEIIESNKNNQQTIINNKQNTTKQITTSLNKDEFDKLTVRFPGNTLSEDNLKKELGKVSFSNTEGITLDQLNTLLESLGIQSISKEEDYWSRYKFTISNAEITYCKILRYGEKPVTETKLKIPTKKLHLSMNSIYHNALKTKGLMPVRKFEYQGKTLYISKTMKMRKHDPRPACILYVPDENNIYTPRVTYTSQSQAVWRNLPKPHIIIDYIDKSYFTEDAITYPIEIQQALYENAAKPNNELSAYYTQIKDMFGNLMNFTVQDSEGTLNSKQKNTVSNIIGIENFNILKKVCEPIDSIVDNYIKNQAEWATEIGNAYKNILDNIDKQNDVDSERKNMQKVYINDMQTLFNEITSDPDFMELQSNDWNEIKNKMKTNETISFVIYHHIYDNKYQALDKYKALDDKCRELERLFKEMEKMLAYEVITKTEGTKTKISNQAHALNLENITELSDMQQQIILKPFNEDKKLGENAISTIPINAIIKKYKVLSKDGKKEYLFANLSLDISENDKKVIPQTIQTINELLNKNATWCCAVFNKDNKIDSSGLNKNVIIGQKLTAPLMEYPIQINDKENKVNLLDKHYYYNGDLLECPAILDIDKAIKRKNIETKTISKEASNNLDNINVNLIKK